MYPRIFRGYINNYYVDYDAGPGSTVHVSAVPVNVGCDTEPDAVVEPAILTFLPVNVGCDTVPAAVVVPVNLNLSPVNVGLDTVPVAVPVTVTVLSADVGVTVYVEGTGMFPVTRRTPVPENVGSVTVAAPSEPTVTDFFVGTAPPEKLSFRFSLAAVYSPFSVATEPTPSITDIDLDATVTAVPDITPAGVYVAVPDEAGATVAVLLLVAFVVTEIPVITFTVPVPEIAPFENVGCDTEPDTWKL